MISLNSLPKFISARYGLADRVGELNRSLPLRDRADGLQVEYVAGGTARVFNRRTDETLGRYIFATNSGKTEKFKLVKEMK